MIWNRTLSPGCARLAPERRPAPTAACVDDLEPDAFAGLREAGAVTASGATMTFHSLGLPSTIGMTSALALFRPCE